MINQWKRLSKINPQREDGTRQINNDVLDAIIKAKLPTIEMGIVLTIISKTWGFNKQSDAISIGQFSESTGYENRNIKRAKNNLVGKRIICVTQSKLFVHGNFITEYMFNKHFDTWLTGGQIATSTNVNDCNNKKNNKTGVNIATGGQIATGGKCGKRLVAISPPTKENTKERKEINKEKSLGIFKIKQSIPKDYLFQKEHLEYALSKNITEEIAIDQFEAFCLWHGAKGTKYVNWLKTYQTWIRKYISNRKSEKGKIQWDNIQF